MPNNLEYRSEEVQELLTKVPPFAIRWGISVFLSVIIFLLSLSYLIKVPEKVEGVFVLNTKDQGVITVPVKSTGVISKGQQVILEFDNYPYEEFGVVGSEVKELQFKEDNNQYVAFTEPIKEMESSYGKRLKRLPLMKGRASIITRDNRLLFKFLPFLNF
jgi:hypothetical protein